MPELMPATFAIRPRVIRRLLKDLRSDQATGPDGISAFFIKKVANMIDVPLAVICRRIFQEAMWPRKWKTHHIVPLFKRGSVYQPSQYRGVHLTDILSKTIERTIAQPLVMFLEYRCFCNAQ